MNFHTQSPVIFFSTQRTVSVTEIACGYSTGTGIENVVNLCASSNTGVYKRF